LFLDHKKKEKRMQFPFLNGRGALASNQPPLISHRLTDVTQTPQPSYRGQAEPAKVGHGFLRIGAGPGFSPPSLREGNPLWPYPLGFLLGASKDLLAEAADGCQLSTASK
jgi:hypothetical protein